MIGQNPEQEFAGNGRNAEAGRVLKALGVKLVKAGFNSYFMNGAPVGFIPFLNQFLYLNTFRGGILNIAVVYGIIPNSIRLNPFFRRTTSWAVYRGGVSNNLGYVLQISVKQWVRINPINRWFGFRWWYGI
jgi:hypothetical protein